MIPESKICGICGLEKAKDRFQIRRKLKGYVWLRLECKDCQNEARKRMYADDPEYRKTIIQRNSEYGRLNKEKRSQYFKEHRLKNLDAKKIKARKRYEKKAEEIKTKRKQYYYDNKEKVIAGVNDYVRRNKPKVRAKQRENHKKRKSIDMEYSILKILRTRVAAAVKRKGTKCARTMQLVGCTMPQLLVHLENKFTDGMSWGNYGIKGWHVDHILPCAFFDMKNPEEQKKCFHYTNLQPLWWMDNLKKSDKIAA